MTRLVTVQALQSLRLLRTVGDDLIVIFSPSLTQTPLLRGSFEVFLLSIADLFLQLSFLILSLGLGHQDLRPENALGKPPAEVSYRITILLLDFCLLDPVPPGAIPNLMIDHTLTPTLLRSQRSSLQTQLSSLLDPLRTHLSRLPTPWSAPSLEASSTRNP